MSEGITRRELIKGMALIGAATAMTHTAGAQQEHPALTIALVGAAHCHTPAFIKMVQSRPNFKVKYVYDHDFARAEKNAKELYAKPTSNLEEIWSDTSVSAVAIYSETNRHLDLVLAAARAHKPMFVEKPLGLGAKDANAMAEAIEKAGLPFTTGYAMRTTPAHLFIKEQIEHGSFGKITRVASSVCHEGSLAGWFDKDWRWMADPTIAGVGAFGDLGTHGLDLLMWLVGDVAAVTAEIKVVTGKYGHCDETGQALIRFKNGVIGTLAAAWVDVANPVSLMVSGTEGHACIFNGQLYFKSKKIKEADGRQPWKALPPPLPHPLLMFLDQIAGKGPQPLVTPREAAARVVVMEAMYEAARRRQWVNVA